MTIEVEKWHTVWKGRFVYVIPLIRKFYSKLFAMKMMEKYVSSLAQ
jgi:hypothetical protein